MYISLTYGPYPSVFHSYSMNKPVQHTFLCWPCEVLDVVLEASPHMLLLPMPIWHQGCLYSWWLHGRSGLWVWEGEVLSRICRLRSYYDGGFVRTTASWFHEGLLSVGATFWTFLPFQASRASRASPPRPPGPLFFYRMCVCSPARRASSSTACSDWAMLDPQRP